MRPTPPKASVLSRRISTVLITGGSGFIGSNLAYSFLCEGRTVVIVDNLSRPGIAENLAWLKDHFPDRVKFQQADVRDRAAIAPAFEEADAVFHLAAQTAVTTSLKAPLDDFMVNALGTLNVLDIVRCGGRRIPVIFASTNKVYGDLSDLELMRSPGGYVPRDAFIRSRGIDEAAGLSFCSPYGCSKGVADQYVLDFAKSYEIPTAVLRMSCIFGPRQFGTEDQGWVAHFILRVLSGEPVVIFGDGEQVRDILYVGDAVSAYRAVLDAIDRLEGQAFNLGGGPENAISLNLLLQELASMTGVEAEVRYSEQRRGDQLYFVADTRKLQAAVGWEAKVGWREGVRQLTQWLSAHRVPAGLSRRLKKVTA
ncbi:SDR family NAD(P)-dependent oxidoreductase [Mesorhizobium sp. KR2-14]|uniref:SDR family NAD(P)-dependent oxidoreductase n=1 Tax=Mesorhizobium sp. KR2-14 TaxID=3156610 RepID=UPI0032B4EEF3